jgi:hypothetical protein
MCDLHATRRGDLVYLRFGVRQESLSIFFLHQIADAIWYTIVCPFCPCRCAHLIAQQMATRNRRVCVNGSNSVSDRESHPPSNCTRNRSRNRSCNQPLIRLCRISSTQIEALYNYRASSKSQPAETTISQEVSLSLSPAVVVVVAF